MTKQPPKHTLTITLRQVDYDKAGRFSDPLSCVLCQALKRMGYSRVLVTPNAIDIREFRFRPKLYLGPRLLGWADDRYNDPKIGLKITATRQ